MLVADDAQLVALESQSLDRRQEVVTAPSVDPAHAKDVGFRPGVEDALVAGELARAVGVDWASGIRLDVSARARAVEDVVGGLVDEERSQAGGRRGEQTRRHAVDALSEGFLFFRAVDVRISRGI